MERPSDLEVASAAEKAPLRPAARFAAPVVIGAAVFLIGLDGGGYGIGSRTALAIAVWWAILVATGLGIWPLARVPLAALATAAFLLAFAATTGLSVFWAESEERAFLEFDRVVLYLGVFVLAVVTAPTGRTARRWIEGMALGITVVGLTALVSRLFPDLVTATGELAQLFPDAQRRLSYPLNYWNGLATFTALGFPLLLFSAVTARAPLGRGLALAPLPALVSTIYLTSSRGGALTAFVATGVFFLLTSRRWAAGSAIMVAGAGSAAAVAVLLARSDLVDRPLVAPGAAAEGRSAALLLALICLGTGAAYALGTRFAPRPPNVPALVRGILFAGAFVLVLGLVAAADPRQRFENFKQVPPSVQQTSVREHLFSGSGSGRWQLWEAAIDEFETKKLAGRGAGSYQAWWAEHGTLAFFVRDAHSLYLETLAELGVLGFGLLVAVFVSSLGAALSRLRGTRDDGRAAVAALTAVVIAFLFEAGFDWVWELPVVALVPFASLGLLTGPATLFGRRKRREDARAKDWRGDAVMRLAAVMLALAFIVGEAVPLLTDRRVRASQAAVVRGDGTDALENALAARSLQPWASTPHLQLALVYEEAGRLEPALRSIEEALRRDSTDWRLWLVAARLQTKARRFQQARVSLARAVELNPRSPLFARLPPPESAG